MLELTNAWFFGVGYKKAVRIDIESFMLREGEDKLPTQRAWCKYCAKETAKIKFPIYMNGKSAYALECEKCGSAHHMYKSTFFTRYVGHDLPNGGRINPTHGVKTIAESMDQKALEYRRKAKKELKERMCQLFNMTTEKYDKIHEKSAEECVKERKKLNAEKADISARITDRKIKEESDKRKDLIQRGVLKYVKGIGLVNTETNEVVKLK